MSLNEVFRITFDELTIDTYNDVSTILTLRGKMAKDKPEAKKERRPQAEKRAIQSEKRRLINKSFKSSVRSAVRKFEEDLSKGDAALTKQNLSEVYSLMDKGVKRGVYKINNASRTKARLTAKAAAK
jgi:small subunit ribosomal protein S20